MSNYVWVFFQKPLSTPKIQNIQVGQEELDNMYLLQTTLKEVCGKNDQFKENKDSISVKKDFSIEKTHNLVIPPPPQTYVQLKQDWKYLQKDSKLLCQYLKVKLNLRSKFYIIPQL